MEAVIVTVQIEYIVPLFSSDVVLIDHLLEKF